MRIKIMAGVAAIALAARASSRVPANAALASIIAMAGGGAIAGFAAGAILGGVLAAQQPYYYGGPGYYEPSYAYAPGRSVAYCEQRFKSYDPRSGTYLGYDGYRHPCP